MSESLLLINAMQIEQGKLEDFKESVKRSLAFVEANGPQLMAEVYVDEKSMRAYSFQLFRDSESMLSHCKRSAPPGGVVGGGCGSVDWSRGFAVASIRGTTRPGAGAGAGVYRGAGSAAAAGFEPVVAAAVERSTRDAGAATRVPTSGR